MHTQIMLLTGTPGKCLAAVQLGGGAFLNQLKEEPGCLGGATDDLVRAHRVMEPSTEASAGVSLSGNDHEAIISKWAWNSACVLSQR